MKPNYAFFPSDFTGLILEKTATDKAVVKKTKI